MVYLLRSGQVLLTHSHAVKSSNCFLAFKSRLTIINPLSNILSDSSPNSKLGKKSFLPKYTWVIITNLFLTYNTQFQEDASYKVKKADDKEPYVLVSGADGSKSAFKQGLARSYGTVYTHSKLGDSSCLHQGYQHSPWAITFICIKIKRPVHLCSLMMFIVLHSL